MFLIDELAKLLKNHGVVAKLFADDVKVYVNIASLGDVSKLQIALDLIVEWAALWQLQLSVSKCSILSVGRTLIKTDYCIGDTVLPYDTKCRDLGVMIMQDLSLPCVHINEITAKPHQRAKCKLHLTVFCVQRYQSINACISCVCTTCCRVLFSHLVALPKARY